MLSDVIYVPAKINRPDYHSHTSVIQNLFRFIYGSTPTVTLQLHAHLLPKMTALDK